MAQRFTVTCCQLAVGACKETNVRNAVSLMKRAVELHPRTDLLVLPECFNSPYGVKHFPENAEALSSSNTLRDIGTFAAEARIHILAGSIPERADDGKLYNTSALIGPSGCILGSYRKVHLFKLDTPQLKFDESETLSPGTALLCFDLPSKSEKGAAEDAKIVPLPPFLADLSNPSLRSSLDAVACQRGESCDPLKKGATALPPPSSPGSLRVGVGICFDVRFPTFAATYAHTLGCDALIYPGAFNMVTGPPHWKLAAQSRAVDTQTCVIMCSPARVEGEGYVAYGHSIFVDAWGEVKAEAGADEGIVSGEVDVEELAEVRRKLPTRPGAIAGFDNVPVVVASAP